MEAVAVLINRTVAVSTPDMTFNSPNQAIDWLRNHGALDSIQTDTTLKTIRLKKVLCNPETEWMNEEAIGRLVGLGWNVVRPSYGWSGTASIRGFSGRILGDAVEAANVTVTGVTTERFATVPISAASDWTWSVPDSAYIEGATPAPPPTPSPEPPDSSVYQEYKMDNGRVVRVPPWARTSQQTKPPSAPESS